MCGYTSQSNANLPLPPAKNVFLTGFVNDLHSRIASSWICLAPIRFGGGTRLKILESMALYTPVVATSKGAEGLNVKDGEHLLIGRYTTNLCRGSHSSVKRQATS